MHPSLKKHYAVLALAVVLTISIFLVLNVPFIQTVVDYSEPEQYSELETIEREANYSSSTWFNGIRTVEEVTGQKIPGVFPWDPNQYVVVYHYFYGWTFTLTNVDIKGGVFNVTMKVAGVDYKKFASYIDAGANKQFNEEIVGYGRTSPVFSVTPPKIIKQELVNKTRIINKTYTAYKSPLQTLLGT